MCLSFCLNLPLFSSSQEHLSENMEQCGWLSFVFCTMFKAPPHPRPTWLQYVYYHMQHRHPLPCHACTELWAEFSPFWDMPAPSLCWLSIGMWVTYTLRPHKSEGFQTFQTFRVHGVQTPPNQVHFMSAIKRICEKIENFELMQGSSLSQEK